MQRKILGLGLAAGLAFAGTASAQIADASDIKARDFLEPAEDRESYDVTLNAGLGTYTGSLGEHTGIGPTWGVTLDGDSTRAIGWELGYQGARTPITTEGLEDGAAVWRHGISGLVKAFVPGADIVRPYAGVGLGAGYVNANGQAEPLYRNDYQWDVPLAAGIDLDSSQTWTAGIRATYRMLRGEEFANEAAGEDVSGNQLSASINFGGQF